MTSKRSSFVGPFVAGPASGHVTGAITNLTGGVNF